MKIPEMREEKRMKYIDNILSGDNFRKGISLWQNLHGFCNTTRASMAKLTMPKNHLNFTPVGKRKFQFDSRKPIYFFEKKRTLIFKSYIIFHSEHSMEVKFPQMVMIEEMRNEVRNRPLKNKLMLARFKFNNGLNSRRNLQFKKQILDYSESGFSIRVPTAESGFYFKDDILELFENGQGQRFGKITYTTQKIDGMTISGSFLKVGVKYIS